MTKLSRAQHAIATGRAVGTKSTATTAGPILGEEQMEQEWCEV